MIRFERISKVFPGSSRPAIADLSIEIPEGEVVTFVGPSGCGKTTALKLINRLIEPTSGRIVLDGGDIAERSAHELRLGIGYVIQQVGLFPHRTVAQNIATVPRLLGWDRDRIRARIDELVELVGLDPDLRGRYPHALSGGQQQRVGVARALAADPPVLLMDEPFAAVDPIVRARLQDELRALQHRLHKTVVFVTHDIDEAIKLGDRMAILNVGAVLEQFDEPAAVLKEPANDFVERFLGGERGLKRLALITLRDISIESGPVAQRDASPAEARAIAQHHGVDWIGVLAGEDLLGWVPVDRFDTEGPRAFAVRLEPDASLRAALDLIVTARAPVAVVCDGPRYLGMVTLETVRTEIAR